MNDNVTSTEEFQRVLECERQFQRAFQQGIEEEQQRKLKIEQDQAAIQQFIQEEREQNIARLKLEIELLKARLDECHRTIAELIRTKPSST